MFKKSFVLFCLLVSISATLPVFASNKKDVQKSTETKISVVLDGIAYTPNAFIASYGPVSDFYTVYKDGTWYAFGNEGERDSFFAQLVAQNPDVLESDQTTSSVQFSVFYDYVNYGGFAAHVYNGDRYCGSQLGSLNNRTSSVVSYSSWYTKMWAGNCSGTSHILWAYSQIPNMGVGNPIGDNNMSGVRLCPYTTPVDQCN